LTLAPWSGGRGSAQDTLAIEKETNVPYEQAGADDSDELILDVYRPPVREKPRPAVVIVFGGSRVMRSKEDWSANAENIAEAGYLESHGTGDTGRPGSASAS
jgi:acetyl esterase/lipase